jgi:hypothetical protein
MKRELGWYQPPAGITSPRDVVAAVIRFSSVAKRSPILGYNHNVRYRGLVFHVQTEDSGVLSPHLFTHLFHGGVIVSTRKLVYDGGSAEDVIKSLMQAQHKAVLKDLKKGAFDDKIDQYLGGTPGLLPRGTDDGKEDRVQTGAMEPLPKPPPGTAPAVDLAVDLQMTRPDIAPAALAAAASSLDITLETGPVAALMSSGVPEAVVGAVTVPSAPPVMAADSGPVARTRTAERTSGPARPGTPPPIPFIRRQSEPGIPAARYATPPIPTPVVSPSASQSMMPPPPEGLDSPTFLDHAAAVAAAMDNARTRQDLGPPMPSDLPTSSHRRRSR